MSPPASYSRKYSLKLPNVILILGSLLSLSVAAVYAGDIVVRVAYTERTLIDIILEANADESDNLYVINLDGSFTFTRPYDTSFSNSPLPEMMDDNFIFNLSETTTINYEPAGGDSGDVVMFRMHRKGSNKPEPSRGLVIFESFFFVDPFTGKSLFFVDPFTENEPPGARPDQKSGFTPGSANTKAVNVQTQQFQFNGFDKLVEASNTMVTIIGINAECGTLCVDTHNSKLVVIGSRLNCDEECIRVKDPGANDTAIDYSSFKNGIKDSGLPSSDISNFLAHMDRSEQLLSDYDVGIVHSDMRSKFTTVSVIRSDFSVNPARVRVDKSAFSTSASSYRALQIQSAGDGNLVTDTVLSGPDSRRKLLDVIYGTVTASNLFINRGTTAIGITEGSVNLSLSAVSPQRRSPEDIADVCTFTFMSDTVHSGGYNIVTDDTCVLDGPGDLENTDPGLFLPDDGSLIPQFAENSPAIDGGPADVMDGSLPCSVTDITGLPRPQDGNGDGIAECDVGPVELQAGDDIGAPQSGSFYDTGRDGEGVFVEMLGNGKAVVYIFSYTPDGTQAFWAVGVGDVIGNGIVIQKEDFTTTEGGIFGDTFDPATVQRIPFADIAISFPDCNNADSEGVLTIEPNDDLGFGPLLSRTTRLTSVLSCDTFTAKGPGFTGSFSDPLHDGEGIIVQAISSTLAVIMWFTFDSDGNQQWITGVGEIDGDTITVTDAFTQTGPSYGPDFDMNDRVPTTWGDFDVVFEAGCNKAVLNYSSIITEYGSGMQNLQRLTNIDGLGCDL